MHKIINYSCSHCFYTSIHVFSAYNRWSRLHSRHFLAINHSPVNKLDWMKENKVRIFFFFIVFSLIFPNHRKHCVRNSNGYIWNRERERECDAKKEFSKYSNRFFMIRIDSFHSRSLSIRLLSLFKQFMLKYLFMCESLSHFSCAPVWIKSHTTNSTELGIRRYSVLGTVYDVRAFRTESIKVKWILLFIRGIHYFFHRFCCCCCRCFLPFFIRADTLMYSNCANENIYLFMTFQQHQHFL